LNRIYLNRFISNNFATIMDNILRIDEKTWLFLLISLVIFTCRYSMSMKRTLLIPIRNQDFWRYDHTTLWGIGVLQIASISRGIVVQVRCNDKSWVFWWIHDQRCWGITQKPRRQLVLWSSEKKGKLMENSRIQWWWRSTNKLRSKDIDFNEERPNRKGEAD